MAAEQEWLGNLIRLAPLHTDDLPAHPDIKDSKDQVVRPDLVAFLQAILDEGINFSESFHTHFKKTGSKPSPPSVTPVDLIARDIRQEELSRVAWAGDAVHQPTAIPRQRPAKDQGEYWIGRRSYHDDRRTAGTAEWTEFVFGLREDHSKHEEEFTPTLYDAYRVLDWNDAIDRLGGSDDTANVNGNVNDNNYNNNNDVVPGFTTIRMSIYEMSHAMPFPVRNRCFPIVVVTADVRADVGFGFIAVTVPVMLSAATSPTAFYSSGRNVDEALDRQKQIRPTFGVYAAVERVRKIVPADTGKENGTGAGTGTETDEGGAGAAATRKGREGQIEWIMATASDAKGSIPMPLQKLGVPGAIVKDVGYFLTWTRKVNPT